MWMFNLLLLIAAAVSAQASSVRMQKDEAQTRLLGLAAAKTVAAVGATKMAVGAAGLGAAGLGAAKLGAGALVLPAVAGAATLPLILQGQQPIQVPQFPPVQFPPVQYPPVQFPPVQFPPMQYPNWYYTYPNYYYQYFQQQPIDTVYDVVEVPAVVDDDGNFYYVQVGPDGQTYYVPIPPEIIVRLQKEKEARAKAADGAKHLDGSNPTVKPTEVTTLTDLDTATPLPRPFTSPPTQTTPSAMVPPNAHFHPTKIHTLRQHGQPQVINGRTVPPPPQGMKPVAYPVRVH